MLCLFMLPLWETFNGLCINQVLAIWCVGTHLLLVFSKTQTHIHTAPAPHHKRFYLVNFMCTLSSHLSIGNHTIKRGPTVGTLAGGATSGDKLALDASTEQICAPPQHCGAETCTAAALDSHGPTCLALLCPHQVIVWSCGLKILKIIT